MSRPRSLMRRLAWQLVANLGVAVVLALSYFGFLGWVRGRNVWDRVYGDDHYAAWQLIPFVVVFALVAWWTGTHRARWTGAATAAVTVTACFVVEWWNQPGDGLWGVGVPLYLVATFVVFAGVAGMSKARATRRGTQARPVVSPPTISPSA